MILDIIILFFLTRRIGLLAMQKGVKPISWKLYTVLAWIVAELIGRVLAILLFGNTNLVAVASIALFGGFGGYLIVRAMLEKKPDYIDKDIDRIGVDDLKPPVNK